MKSKKLLIIVMLAIAVFVSLNDWLSLQKKSGNILPNKTTASIDTNLTFKFNDYKVRATISVGSDTLYIKDPNIIVIYDTLE